MSWVKRLFGGAGAAQNRGAAARTPFDPPSNIRYRFTDPGVRIVATGDIHGRADLLRRHLPEIDALAAKSSRRLIEIYLGDYVDRTGDSREVIDLLWRRKAAASHEMVFLMGNHEQMMREGLDDDDAFRAWIAAGGHSTLKDYGISPAGAQSDARGKRESLARALHGDHRAFLDNLQYAYRRAGFFFTHAGVRPGVPLDAQRPEDLLWIRDEFLRSTEDHGGVVVHGHTPAPRPVYNPNRIGIDTGAYYTGNLMSVVIDSDAVTAIVTSMNDDDAPPEPD